MARGDLIMFRSSSSWREMRRCGKLCKRSGQKKKVATVCGSLPILAKAGDVTDDLARHFIECSRVPELFQEDSFDMLANIRAP
jgi:hypothetical protein